MLIRNSEDVRRSQVAEHKVIFVQNLQRFGDSVEDLTGSRMGMLVEQLT